MEATGVEEKDRILSWQGKFHEALFASSTLCCSGPTQGRQAVPKQNLCWVGCFQAFVFSRNHTGCYLRLGLARSLQGNNLPAEDADLLKPLLLCGKGLVFTRFSLGEFLANRIEFLSQNRQELSGLGFSPLLSQIQNRILKAGFLHARNTNLNHRTAALEHMCLCMKDSEVYCKFSSLCEIKKISSLKKCGSLQKLSSYPGVLQWSYWLSSLVLQVLSLLDVLLWSEAKNPWRPWQSNQLVSDRRGKTDPEALLVYFVRVKAVQGYITPKPLLPLRNIIRESTWAAKENRAEHCCYVWAIVIGQGRKNNAWGKRGASWNSMKHSCADLIAVSPAKARLAHGFSNRPLSSNFFFPCVL